MKVLSGATGAMIYGAAMVFAASAPSAAQTPAQPVDESEGPAPAVGALVLGKDGTELGKIDFVGRDVAVINTGKVRAPVERDAFKTAPTGWKVNISLAELEAAVAKMNEEASAGVKGLLKLDAIVRASDGKAILGTVSDVGDSDFILRTSSSSILLESSMLRADEQGLKLTMSEAEFAAATKPRR